MRFKTDLCCGIAWDALAFGTGIWSEWNVFSACVLWFCPCVDNAFMQDLHLFATVVVCFLGWEWGQSSVVILMLKSTFKRWLMALCLLWGSTQWQEHSSEGDGWVLRGRTGGIMQTWKMRSKEKWEKRLPGRPCVSSLNRSIKIVLLCA